MVGSTPTRFRQMLDDSIAFVGVRTQKTTVEPGVLFPSCSQILAGRLKRKTPGSDESSIPIVRSISPQGSRWIGCPQSPAIPRFAPRKPSFCVHLAPKSYAERIYTAPCL